MNLFCCVMQQHTGAILVKTGLDQPMAKDWNIAITEKNKAPVELSPVESAPLVKKKLPGEDLQLQRQYGHQVPILVTELRLSSRTCCFLGSSWSSLSSFCGNQKELYFLPTNTVSFSGSEPNATETQEECLYHLVTVSLQCRQVVSMFKMQ
ncbi:uncharacterized protein ACIBXB_006494 isoform 1-T1 [Morphnus guianensis]